MEIDKVAEARELHATVEFIGLRAHATSVGLIQLCAELMRAGLLDAEAVQRIKDAIQREITVSNSRGYARAEFEKTVKERLDAIFPNPEGPENRANVGPASELGSALHLRP